MIDLHELANTPGAGKAKQALIKAGQWDEDYTFQDVCDFLDKKTVTITFNGNVVIHHEGELFFIDDYFESKLRNAMEGKR